MNHLLWVKVCQLYAKLKDLPRKELDLRHLQFAKNLYDHLDPNNPSEELSDLQIKHLGGLWERYFLKNRKPYRKWK